ncbi:MAG: 16S rRNA (guanine(527)-N(7))-methyltransferase RsmG [Ignavibacteriaceae bacterium]|mgnify:CR=1 FL=1|nr:16S rRNA (guanine(527)-N(7))-methyltransferase RsmG [Ignavibacteriaceae bacterium]
MGVKLPDTKEKYLREVTNFYWENGYNPEITQMERLAHFADLVVKKNEDLNLISRKDTEFIIENHVFVSAFITKYIPERCTKFLDIGTGGGFPGIPIAVMRPDLNGVLVDSIGKKIEAVKDFVDKLMLNNAHIENMRVEAPEFIDKYKNSFDLFVTRGTEPLIVLLRYILPLMKDKAYLMAIKGGDLSEEFQKVELKYKSNIKKSTVYELHYKPSNIRNVKGKKLVLLELIK